MYIHAVLYKFTKARPTHYQCLLANVHGSENARKCHCFWQLQYITEYRFQ